MVDKFDVLIYSLTKEQKLELKERLESFLLTIPEGQSAHDNLCSIIDDLSFTIQHSVKQEEATIAAEKGETTIPVDEWGVHTSHCCSTIGCKYGDIDCPVTLGLAQQKYECEYCDDVCENGVCDFKKVKHLNHE